MTYFLRIDEDEMSVLARKNADGYLKKNNFAGVATGNMMCPAPSLMAFMTGHLIKFLTLFQAVLEKQSYMLIGRHDIENLMKLDPANSCLYDNVHSNPSDAYGMEVEKQMSDLLLSLRPIKQENLIRDDNKLTLLASLSDSLEYVADSIERQGISLIILLSISLINDLDACIIGYLLFNTVVPYSIYLFSAYGKSPFSITELGKTFSVACSQVEEKRTKQRTPRLNEVSNTPKDLPSFADDYRKLSVDCLKVLRVEMQLETVFHMQGMASREYMDDIDAEEPDDFVISLTAQITRRDEAIAPFVSKVKQNYIFGGVCGVAAHASIKALAEMKSINLFGVQQICRNSIAVEQAVAAIPSIDSEAVQLRLDRVRTYFELLNMPFEALLAFIMEHEDLFTPEEYSNLLKILVPGRDIPADALDRPAITSSSTSPNYHNPTTANINTDTNTPPAALPTPPPSSLLPHCVPPSATSGPQPAISGHGRPSLLLISSVLASSPYLLLRPPPSFSPLFSCSLLLSSPPSGGGCGSRGSGVGVKGGWRWWWGLESGGGVGVKG
ncbi:hypothetical protein KSS87_007212 [Heliosperma pusillum]|nr:hypothetical protein KSS87_007212 [Heliosperma pusillum]